jgi:hypothetical protein
MDALILPDHHSPHSHPRVFVQAHSQQSGSQPSSFPISAKTASRKTHPASAIERHRRWCGHLLISPPAHPNSQTSERQSGRKPFPGVCRFSGPLSLLFVWGGSTRTNPDLHQQAGTSVTFWPCPWQSAAHKQPSGANCGARKRPPVPSPRLWRPRRGFRPHCGRDKAGVLAADAASFGFRRVGI